MKFNVNQIRKQFPILKRVINDNPLVYLDNGATTQKPQVVIDAIVDYYSQHNSNVHRGVHTISDESTHIWEEARTKVANFFGAKSPQLIVTRNTTEALNIMAQGWGAKHIKKQDVILVGLSEHHSNFVPWQMMAQKNKAEFRVIPLQEDGQLEMEAFEALLDEYGSRVRLLALQHVSNTLGTVMPVKKINQLLKDKKLKSQVTFVLDAAQSAAHMPLNLQELEVEAIAFSGHKMYGPMGVGGLVVSSKILDEMEPVLFGGGMIDVVSAQETTFNPDAAERFTAGTPDVASLHGLARAMDFIQDIGWPAIEKQEEEVLSYGLEKLQELDRVQVVGPLKTRNAAGELIRAGALTWLYEGVHAHDVAQVLDRFAVAVRSGHHCTMPLHTTCGWASTTRASLAVYNTTQDIDKLVEGIKYLPEVFG